MQSKARSTGKKIMGDTMKKNNAEIWHRGYRVASGRWLWLPVQSPVSVQNFINLAWSAPGTWHDHAKFAVLGSKLGFKSRIFRFNLGLEED